MEETLELINQMQAEGVICHYAIGGALAAAYYSEPATVLEIEVLVILPFDPNGSSVTLKALQDYLIAGGCKENGEHFDVEGWPVKSVPANTNLEREAVANSLPVSVDAERVWVMMAEYLIAIALVTNRLKDTPWILRLVERHASDELTLKSILKSHHLIERWAGFEQRFPPQFGNPQELGGQLASLSFSEKIKILKKLRDRDRAIAAARVMGKAQGKKAANENEV